MVYICPILGICINIVEPKVRGWSWIRWWNHMELLQQDGVNVRDYIRMV